MFSRIVFVLLLLANSSAYAENCDVVAQGFEAKDTMYVLCKEISLNDRKGAIELVEKIMDQYKGPPDEIIVYFVGSQADIGNVNPTSENLVGFYYTHSNELIVWPGSKSKKRVFRIR